MKNKLLSGLYAGMVLAAVATSGYAYGSASDNQHETAVNWDVYCNPLCSVHEGLDAWSDARQSTFTFSSGNWLYDKAMVGVDQGKLTSVQIKQWVSSRSEDEKIGFCMASIIVFAVLFLKPPR